VNPLSRGILALLLVILAGCSSSDKSKAGRPKTVPSSGVVTLDGEPLGGAQIVLVPEGGQHSASAMSNEDGTFELMTFNPDPGVVPGSYKVMITKSMTPAPFEGPDGLVSLPGKLLTPKKYADPNKSGLSAQIPDDERGQRALLFELKSK